MRNHMVKCVLVRMPSIYSYVNAAYGSQSVLRFGQYRIASAAGVQQGDPLGPLLFALSIRLLSHESIAPFSIWYLDDATIGGNGTEVIAEVARIKQGASEIGLELNSLKCELVSSSPAFVTALRTALPGCKEIKPETGKLLGAPIGRGAVTACLNRRADALQSIAERLHRIYRHDALALLRSSLGHPRTIYNLRTGACFRDPMALAHYDEVLREVLSNS